MTPRLVVLTDRRQLPGGRDLVSVVTDCVEAGLAAVIVREHDLPARERRALVAGLAELPGLTVISSRLVDPAADGLHQSAAAETPVGQGILGRSCHSADDVRRAAAAGVDYATLSPFAPTASKPGHGPPVREQEFVGLPIPTLALGGVTVGNAALARAAGAHGVAVMGEVMRSDHPGRTVAQLLAVVG